MPTTPPTFTFTFPSPLNNSGVSTGGGATATRSITTWTDDRLATAVRERLLAEFAQQFSDCGEVYAQLSIPSTDPIVREYVTRAAATCARNKRSSFAFNVINATLNEVGIPYTLSVSLTIVTMMEVHFVQNIAPQAPSDAFVDYMIAHVKCVDDAAQRRFNEWLARYGKGKTAK